MKHSRSWNAGSFLTESKTNLSSISFNFGRILVTVCVSEILHREQKENSTHIKKPVLLSFLCYIQCFPIVETAETDVSMYNNPV